MRRTSDLALGLVVTCLGPVFAADAVQRLPNAFYPMDTAIQRNLASLDVVKELGFDGAAWFLQDPQQVKAARTAMRERNLRMFAIYAGVRIDAAGELQTPPDLTAAMQALKGEATVIWLSVGGTGPATERLDGREPFVRALRELADQARANGLRIAVYPHVGDYTPRFADAIRLARAVKHEQFGVTFTLCHSLAGGEEDQIASLLKESGPMLFSVCLNGADRGITGPNWERLIQTLDKGTLDLGEVLRVLAEVGYLGPIAFQGYGIKGEPRSILAPTMAAWKRLSATTAEQITGPLRHPGDARIRVLLVGGRGHDWKGFGEALAPVLARTGHFDLTVTTDLDELRLDSLKRQHVVLFYGSGGEFTRPEQEHGLRQYLREGGGLTGVHATDAFKSSDLYWRLLGSRFTTHGGGSFTVRIEKPRHPITAPMADFEIEDESYQGDYHPEFSLQSLGRIDRGHERQSMIWVQQIGRGRVFNTTLGHDTAAWRNPQFQRLLIRGLYWSAGYEPLDPP